MKCNGETGKGTMHAKTSPYASFPLRHLPHASHTSVGVWQVNGKM